MPRLVKALITIGVLGLIAYIITSSMGLGKVSCEVCMEFRGREACRTARAASREEAIDTARGNACAQIAQGRTDGILCGGSQPASIRCSE